MRERRWLCRPKLVGEYQRWFIDVGEAIDLAADGTFVRRGIGICPISPTVRGRWSVTGGRVVLHATEGRLFGGVPLDAAFLDRNFAVVLAPTVDGTTLTVVDDPSGDSVFHWHGMEWTRHAPPVEAR